MQHTTGCRRQRPEGRAAGALGHWSTGCSPTWHCARARVVPPNGLIGHLYGDDDAREANALEALVAPLQRKARARGPGHHRCFGYFLEGEGVMPCPGGAIATDIKVLEYPQVFLPSVLLAGPRRGRRTRRTSPSLPQRVPGAGEAAILTALRRSPRWGWWVLFERHVEHLGGGQAGGAPQPARRRDRARAAGRWWWRQPPADPRYRRPLSGALLAGGGRGRDAERRARSGTRCLALPPAARNPVR